MHSTPDILSLKAGDLIVDLAPAAGGSMAAMYSLVDGGRFDWLRPATAYSLRKRLAEGMASFPLIPFCNRIRNGRAEFQGRAIAMAPNRGNSPHTIHGTAWQMPWSVADYGDRWATLQLDCPAGIWPYHFTAFQHIVLTPDRLAVTIKVQNQGQLPMPLGVGHHPYLPHRPGTTLQVSVTDMWLSDADLLPTGLSKSAAAIERLRQGGLLSDIVLDNNFIGWDRRARVEWPASDTRFRGSALTLRADSPLDYFVLYSPQGADHFCIEPVSNCTDWLNLQQYLPQQIGGAVLGPGEAYEATFSLEMEWLAG